MAQHEKMDSFTDIQLQGSESEYMGVDDEIISTIKTTQTIRIEKVKTLIFNPVDREKKILEHIERVANESNCQTCRAIMCRGCEF